MGRSELYIGNLNKDVTSRDIENVFRKHGKVVRCEVKNKGYGPVYAFIEFEDERDAEVNGILVVYVEFVSQTYSFAYIRTHCITRMARTCSAHPWWSNSPKAKDRADLAAIEARAIVATSNATSAASVVTSPAIVVDAATAIATETVHVIVAVIAHVIAAANDHVRATVHDRVRAIAIENDRAIDPVRDATARETEAMKRATGKFPNIFLFNPHHGPFCVCLSICYQQHMQSLPKI